METKNKNLGSVLGLDLSDEKDLHDLNYSCFINKNISDESFYCGSVWNRIHNHELQLSGLYEAEIALKYSLEDEECINEHENNDTKEDENLNSVDFLYSFFFKDMSKKRLNCFTMLNLKQKRKAIKEPSLFVSGLALSFLEAMKISKYEIIELLIEKEGEYLILQMKDKLPFMKLVKGTKNEKRLIVKKENLEKFIKENKIAQKEKNITNFELKFEFKNE